MVTSVATIQPQSMSLAHEEERRLLASGFDDEPVLTPNWVRGHLAPGGSRGRFTRFYQQCREADRFYLGDFEFSVPEGGSRVRLGTFQSVIDAGVAHLAPSHIDIDVPQPSPRGKARAELIEKFLSGAHHILEQKTPVKRELIKHQFLYGCAWGKYEFEGSQWAEFPEPPEEGEDDSEYKQELEEALSKRHIAFPIIAESVNPQEMVWDINSIRPRWVIRVRRADAAWVGSHFPNWKRSHVSGMVEFVEVWTDKQVAYMADNVWAMPPRRHGYGRNPYVFFDPQTGLRRPGADPHDRYRGIGHGNFEMLRAESKLASQYLDQTVKAAWRTLNFSGPSATVAQAIAQYSQAPGAMNHVPPGVTVEASEVAEVPQSVIVAKQMLTEAIEANTTSGVVRGQRPSGAASGYETAVLSGIAALKFGAVQESTQRGLQEVNELILRIVEGVIRDSVTVWGKVDERLTETTLRPRDIRGHYINMVSMSTVSPEEQERKVNLWSQMWRTGFVDHQTALRNAGVSNPLEVSASIASEQWLNHPLVQQAFAQVAAQSVPLIQQALEAVQADPAASDQLASAINAQNTQGPDQLPNAGNFGPGNQAGTRPQTPGTGQPTTTRPVVPGSLRESNLRGRQLSGPRSGNVRVPGRDLPPGLGV